MTGLDIIVRAMRKIGALPSAPSKPSASEAVNGLATLNDLLDSWNAERNSIFTINPNVVVPATLKQTYSLGPGGDFNLPRPSRLVGVSVIAQPNSSQPYELPPLDMFSDKEWQNIPVKSTQSAYPTGVFDSGDFPLRLLSFWPVPTNTIYFALYLWGALTQFPDLTTDLTFPPGYARAIVNNLAVELMADFPANTEGWPLVMAVAKQSRSIFRSSNSKSLVMSCDPGLGGGQGNPFNWRTGQ